MALPLPSIPCLKFHFSSWITQLRLHPRLVLPCHTTRYFFRWHWIHLNLVLLRVLRWYSLAKCIVTDLPRIPFRHVQNPLISGTRLKWYSNDKVMSHACLRLSHNSLTRSQVPAVLYVYIRFSPLMPTILTLSVRQLPFHSQETEG